MSDATRTPTRVNVLGVGVSVLNPALARETIAGWIERGERHYVCVSGVHGVMESQRDPALRRIHNAAGLVTPDGMPLIWLLRLAGHAEADRVYGPDLMLALLALSEQHGWRHYLYGASDATQEALRRAIGQRLPRAAIVDGWAPPFRPLSPEEDEAAVARINASGADIVWVGLSTPKQERWMAEHRERLTAPVLVGVGAAFDFHAGRIRQAPPFIQRSGLEWLFRLAMEPRRLWRRYLRNNPAFAMLILAQMTGLRRWTLD
jgi:N-acetylglucosaminyldiphosphoundecaprenol N-acetyl-beta-D-mannosaminyltransferase